MSRIFFILFGIWLVVVGVYHTQKALPPYVSYAGPVHQVAAEDVHFLQDRTYLNEAGQRVSEQEIFDELFTMIDAAKHYILVDFFLFNDYMGTAKDDPYRALADELTTALLEKKAAEPDISIQVITDPVNIVYGGTTLSQLEELRAAGIAVVVTDLRPLRDSNPVYSSLWRTLIQWFGVSDVGGLLPNPLDFTSDKVTIRSYLALLNFKANHRKVAIADFPRGDGSLGVATLVASANPHDGSSAHSNSAVRIDGLVWEDVLVGELSVIDFSGGPLAAVPSEFETIAYGSTTDSLQVQLLTEQQIKLRLLEEMATLQAGDRLDMAMFYLADRDVVTALKQADDRGVAVRLLLDPSKDAFGREKNGQPNRQVAHELVQHSAGNTVVRWCDTHGEQCHSKLTLLTRGEMRTALLGSANLTRRNLDDYNLETNVLIGGGASSTVFIEMDTFFTTQWDNSDGQYSVDYTVYEDTSLAKTITYRFKEWSGLSRW